MEVSLAFLPRASDWFQFEGDAVAGSLAAAKLHGTAELLLLELRGARANSPNCSPLAPSAAPAGAP